MKHLKQFEGEDLIDVLGSVGAGEPYYSYYISWLATADREVWGTGIAVVAHGIENLALGLLENFGLDDITQSYLEGEMDETWSEHVQKHMDTPAKIFDYIIDTTELAARWDVWEMKPKKKESLMIESEDIMAPHLVHQMIQKHFVNPDESLKRTPIL